MFSSLFTNLDMRIRVSDGAAVGGGHVGHALEAGAHRADLAHLKNTKRLNRLASDSDFSKLVPQK